VTKLIIFRAERGEITKYHQATETKTGAGFYRIANPGSVPSLIDTVAEYRWNGSKPMPDVGYRLTETVPDDRDSFTDSGWEVTRTEDYTSDLGSEFELIRICYCAYRPLPMDKRWTKKAQRYAPSLASFGGRKDEYEAWLATQSPEVQQESRKVTALLQPEDKEIRQVATNEH
jgi:hypothetical protein